MKAEDFLNAVLELQMPATSRAFVTILDSEEQYLNASTNMTAEDLAQALYALASQNDFIKEAVATANSLLERASRVPANTTSDSTRANQALEDALKEFQSPLCPVKVPNLKS